MGSVVSDHSLARTHVRSAGSSSNIHDGGNYPPDSSAPTLDQSLGMTPFSFQHVDSSAELAGTKIAPGLEAKLVAIRDFLEGRSKTAPTGSDITAANIAQMLAAYADNPYVIVDRTGPRPTIISAPDTVWGSILRSGAAPEEATLELHNNSGRLELPISVEENDLLIQEISTYRAKCA